MISRSRSLCLSLLAAAALAACGGGSDDPAPPTTAVPASGTPTATAPSTNAVLSAKDTGNLNYAVLSPNGIFTAASAAATFSGVSGSLVVNPSTPQQITLSTTNDYSDITVSGATSAAFELDGNALLVCNGSVGSVAVSHNMVRVNDPSVLAGKTFEYVDCASDGSVAREPALTFNANGTATENLPGGAIISAAEIAAYFSSAGLLDGGDTFKGTLYSLSVAGQPTRFFISDLSDDRFINGVRSPFVGMLVQVP